MRMQDLSRASGLPVPTVKYYLREGLLAPGERTGPNQARYGAEHLRRLRLVRALLELGGLSLAQVRAVLRESRVLPPPPSSVPVSEANRRWALDRIEVLARARRWEVADDGPAVTALVEVLCTLRELCSDALLERVDDYADLADAITDFDRAGRHDAVSAILGDALLVALRRLARESADAPVPGDR
jgi:DNA-binding transcriptional MerR regulator